MPSSIGTWLIVTLMLSASAASRIDAQDPPLGELLHQMAALPYATHNSELRADKIRETGMARVWINANEDDTRLYTPAGGQMDVDFQISAVVRPGTIPDAVTLVIETRGPVHPGPGRRTLELHAGAWPLRMTQRELPPARSGPLLFLSMQADIPMGEFLRMIISPSADGRVWDVPFRLLAPQLELLRAWARCVTGVDPLP